MSAIAAIPQSISPPIRAAGESVFDQDWWLDAAAPGAWDRVEVIWDNQRVGSMAYCLTRGKAFRSIRMPPLTRTMSPLIMPPDRQGAISLIQTEAIVRELHAKLPGHDRFERTLEVGCPSVQGFTHLGMPATHFYTLRSAPGEGVDALFRKARPKSRRMAQRAERECEVERNTDVDRFIRLHRLSYSGENSVDHVQMRRIFEAASSRNQAEILFIREEGVDAAALVLVWDSTVTYCWLAARNRDVGDGASNRLVFVEALRSAHARGTILDIDGYANTEVAIVLMKLGFEPAPRPYVNGSSRAWMCYWTLRTLLNPKRYNRHYNVP